MAELDTHAKSKVHEQPLRLSTPESGLNSTAKLIDARVPCGTHTRTQRFDADSSFTKLAGGGERTRLIERL